MYEYLKKMLEAAESIGKIEYAELIQKKSYCPDGVEIGGVTADGRAFEIKLRVSNKEDAE